MSPSSYSTRLPIYLTLFLCFILQTSYSQNMNISGTVTDTVLKTPIKNAVITVSRINDSVLLAYKRSDAKGFFEFADLKIDTVKVTISSKGFGDQLYYLFASPTNFEFGFGKVILPPKTNQLSEVIIYAYKDPVYYKGDTLVYAADSFKVKPNATVEDLLKKLPGITVDGDGKITSQGTAVDKVLVDGDEFFGNDATIATRNIAAKGVESVKVYEKKNEDAKEGAEDKIQVLDLKLKADFKKGYFGRVSAASDFHNFYNGELLINRFKGARKIAIYTLASNTPTTSFSMKDALKFGLSNELNSREQGGVRFFTSANQPQSAGIPQTLKPGFYYTDQLSKKTKLKFNYSFNSNKLDAFSTTTSHYFLADTNYITDNVKKSVQQLENHVINATITQTLDSLTTLQIEPKLKFNNAKLKSSESTAFKNAATVMEHQNKLENNSIGNGYDISTNFELTKKFRKKDRFLKTEYDFNVAANDAKEIVKSANTFYNSTIPSDSINQQKVSDASTTAHELELTYVEPLTPKIKLEFNYLYNNSLLKQNKQTHHFINGEYTGFDSLFSNQFENKRTINRAGVDFIYEVKKQTLRIGGRYNTIFTLNVNETTGKIIPYNVSNFLPAISYMYKPADNSRINFRYRTSSNQPSINQLQPVPDNSNPNQINVGNPNLLPSYNHDLRLTYNIYKALSDKHIWFNGKFTTIENAFASNIVFDSIGRRVIKTVNINGNYDGAVNVGGGISFFNRKFKLFPSLSTAYNVYSSYINFQKNSTKNLNISPTIKVMLDLDTLQLNVSYNYDYNAPVSTLSTASNKPYSQQKITASIFFKLPLKFSIDTDVAYVINSNRAGGYNINYVLFNASINKAFLKTENLIVSVVGNDIFNQNINTNREVQDNVITDSKTNVISRYFLLKMVYKFNGTKTKENEPF